MIQVWLMFNQQGQDVAMLDNSAYDKSPTEGLVTICRLRWHRQKSKTRSTTVSKTCERVYTRANMCMLSRQLCIYHFDMLLLEIQTFVISIEFVYLSTENESTGHFAPRAPRRSKGHSRWYCLLAMISPVAGLVDLTSTSTRFYELPFHGWFEGTSLLPIAVPW